MEFTYKLEHEDGTPVDPPTFRSAPGLTWIAGDTILLADGRYAWSARDWTRAPTAILSRCSWWNRSSLLGGAAGLTDPQTRSVLPRRTPLLPAQGVLYKAL